MKKISVIVPIYNSEKYLHRCINSIISQTYKNLEIILVDDGSTDNSGMICDQLATQDERIRVFHKKNGGLSSARNLGIEVASGDYIAFVDSDDWLADDIYEYCIDLAEKNNCDVIDYNVEFTNGNGTKKAFGTEIKYDIEIIEGKEILRDYLMKGQTEKAPFTVWRKLYKRHLFETIRFPEGKINEDIVLNYKILKRCNKIACTNKVGYYYFQSEESITRNCLKKRDFDLLDACEELIALTEEEDYTGIKYLAKVKNARSYFSLLAKIAFYGIEDEGLNQQKVIRYLTQKLRENYFLLMASPMPFNRKLMVTALCVDLHCLSFPLKIYKYIRKLFRNRF